MASTPVAELPNLLIEMGMKLQNPPDDLKERLSLLDNVEGLFSRLEENASFPVLHSLSLAKEGLIAKKMLGSKNIDVKVSSLVCLHELIRIAAPNVLFEDEKMKEIYEESLKSFEHLSLGTGRNFDKATRILGLVAKEETGLKLVASHASLVVKIFQIFLSGMRSDYPSDVVSNMENLMIVLIRGAHKLSLDIMRPLIMCIGTERQGISASSRGLARKVLENCSTEAKPFLIQMADKMKRDLELLTNATSSLWPEPELVPPEENVISLDSGGSNEQIQPLPSQSGSVEEINKRKRGLPKRFTEDYVLYGQNKVSTKRKKKEAIKNDEEPKANQELKIPEKYLKNPEELLGLNIKVWWPQEQEYYEGVIKSYDPKRERHEVAYLDGLVKRTRLKEEEWSLVPADEADNGRGEGNTSDPRV